MQTLALKEQTWKRGEPPVCSPVVPYREGMSRQRTMKAEQLTLNCGCLHKPETRGFLGAVQEAESQPRGSTAWRARKVGLPSLFLSNKPTKLLKTLDSVPKTNKTIPISDTVGGMRFRVAMGGESSGGNQSLPGGAKPSNLSIFFSKNKATKLLKTNVGCPQSDKTIPILGLTDLLD